MSSKQLQYDIVIAGAGIAGLTLAALLAESGLRIAMVERFESQPPGEPAELRVSAISRASMQVFERCGVAQDLIAQRATAFEQMHVWDVSGAGEIHFDSADMGLETLGYIIENSRIQQALMQRVAACDNIELLCPANIVAIEWSEASSQLQLEDGGTLACRLVIGADGVHSFVRSAANIAFKRSPYDQSGLVCVVATEHPHQHTAWQVFHADGPLAFLPMFDQSQRHQCSIVWTLPSAVAEQYAELDEAEFISRLEQAFQYRLGSLQLVSERAAFPLQHGHVERYVQNGMALIGDAAHIIHPLAGQGANLGIHDADSLAGILLQARQAQRNWSAWHTLRAYERSRKGENMLMENAMTGFNLLFSNDNPWLALVRNAGLNAVDQASFVKHRFMRHAMGI
jgi:2-octaprenylphenol hydroxylase